MKMDHTLVRIDSMKLKSEKACGKDSLGLKSHSEPLKSPPIMRSFLFTERLND